MGLDMYLSKKSYVKQWEHRKPEDQFNVSVKKGGVTYPNIKPERISYVTEELMYWRKANQIHGWFCTNGEEEINEVKYRLTKTDLDVLLETCKSVLEVINKSKKRTIQVAGGWKDGEEYMVDKEVYDNEDVIKDLLPPTEGFFYGAYEIDEWYKQNIEETLEFLEKELPNCEEDDEFEYYASW
jgi:hypothetical protein